MQKVTFYHAGCSVCVAAEQQVLNLVDENKFELDIVHFSDQPNRIDEAEALGVKSVPALVMNDQVFHINFGASMADVKAS